MSAIPSVNLEDFLSEDSKRKEQFIKENIDKKLKILKTF